MRVAIMQPYLFPYIGYFQLISSVDLFIVYDDVQYIKGGWINRNRLLINNEPSFFSFSIHSGSHTNKINEKIFSELFPKEKKRFGQTIQAAYSKAPYYKEIVCLIDKIFQCEERNIAGFITNQLFVICEYLNINTKIILSSAIDNKVDLSGEARIIDICSKFNADRYINPIGGSGLYSKAKFADKGIELFFLESKMIKYPQYNSKFIPYLSIIDLLMFNSKEDISRFLKEYELV